MPVCCLLCRRSRARRGGCAPRRVRQIGLQAHDDGHAGRRLQGLTREIPVDRRRRAAERLVEPLRQQLHVRIGALALRIHRRMHFQQQLAVDEGRLHRLVDQVDLGADGNQGNSEATSSGYIRMQPCVTAMPTAIGLLVPWIM